MDINSQQSISVALVFYKHSLQKWYGI